MCVHEGSANLICCIALFITEAILEILVPPLEGIDLDMMERFNFVLDKVPVVCDAFVIYYVDNILGRILTNTIQPIAGNILFRSCRCETGK